MKKALLLAQAYLHIAQVKITFDNSENNQYSHFDIILIDFY